MEVTSVMSTEEEVALVEPQCMVDWDRVQPVFSPPSFDLSSLLKEAVSWESHHAEHEETSTFGGASDGQADPPHDLKRKACSIADPAPNAPKKPKRSHAHRQLKRNQQITEGGHNTAAKVASANVLGAILAEAAQRILKTSIQLEDLPASSCGYRAKSQRSSPRDVHTLEYYRSLGYTVLKNDGFQTFPIINSTTNQIISMVVGKPKNDPTFDTSCAGAFSAMEHARENETFSLREIYHQRGDFAVVNTGITRGPGSDAPINLHNGVHSNAVQDLLNNHHLRRLATYASAVFSFWAPRLFKYYKDHLDPLLERMKNLEKNFEKSVFTSAAFNFGPCVCTIAHRDCMNCPFGWCAIQSLGNFDHTLGGHLVIKELKLLIEFPPGPVILIPSAVFTHANTPVQAGEKRASFTQYCAGALFRYVDNNFMTQDAFQASVSQEEFEMKMKEKKTRWKDGLGLFSTLDELFEDAKRRAEQAADNVEEGQL
ncbi:hypothetical protein MD484_g8460, partial [Candolleomyces efflorescens]